VGAEELVVLDDFLDRMRSPAGIVLALIYESVLAELSFLVGTIAILILSPKVAYGDAGFPLLSLPGEFLLKDTVLMAASATLSALASTRESMMSIHEMHLSQPRRVPVA